MLGYHPIAARHKGICCDCLLEEMGYRPFVSIYEIMFRGPLNVWAS
jgi:hypothetical protein